METTAAWYYVDANHQRRGPLTREAFLEAFHREGLDATTLVWRSGLAAWQPLASVVDELGLRGHVPPPPVAPRTFATAATTTVATASASDDIVYAGFLKRWAALIIDSLILFVPTFVLAFVLGFIVALARGASPNPLWAQGIGYLAWVVVAPFYYAGFESSRHQATLGKQAIGIKVTDLAGRRISLGRALGRWFAATLSYLSLYIGFFMAGFTERKQALHDYVAGTLVVDRWAFSDQPERQQRTLGAGVIVLAIVPVAFIAIAGILAAIALPAYQDYTLRAKVSQALVQGDALKTAVAEALAESDHCPENGEAGIEAASSYASGIVSGITVAPRANGRCGVDIALGVPATPQLDNHTIHLTFDRTSSRWDCRTDLPRRLVPAFCETNGPAIAR